jgi:hypothetical protein
MKFVKLPSGVVLNLDTIESLGLTPPAQAVIGFVSGTETAFSGADGEELNAWASTRPVLVRPRPGKKVKP